MSILEKMDGWAFLRKALELAVEHGVTLSELRVLLKAVELAREHDVKLGDLLGRSRDPWPTRARHDFWAWLYDIEDISYPRIAELVGRDHATVIAGVRKARDRAARAQESAAQ